MTFCYKAFFKGLRGCWEVPEAAIYDDFRTACTGVFVDESIAKRGMDNEQGTAMSWIKVQAAG
jgi:hypothetical protein